MPLPDPGSVPGSRALGTEAQIQASTTRVVAPVVHLEQERSAQRSAQPSFAFQNPLSAQSARSRQHQQELPRSNPPGLFSQAIRSVAANPRAVVLPSSLSHGSQQQAGTPGPALDGRGHPSGGRKNDRVPPERTREACGSPQVCNLFLLTCLSHQCQKHSIRM